jgi:serine/threonine protein kinase
MNRGRGRTTNITSNNTNQSTSTTTAVINNATTNRVTRINPSFFAPKNTKKETKVISTPVDASAPLDDLGGDMYDSALNSATGSMRTSPCASPLMNVVVSSAVPSSMEKDMGYNDTTTRNTVERTSGGGNGPLNRMMSDLQPELQQAQNEVAFGSQISSSFVMHGNPLNALSQNPPQLLRANTNIFPASQYNTNSSSQLPPLVRQRSVNFGETTGTGYQSSLRPFVTLVTQGNAVNPFLAPRVLARSAKTRVTTASSLLSSSGTSSNNAKQSPFSFNFEQLGILGSGGFSEVLRARSRVDGCVYAVKRDKVPERLKRQAPLLRRGGSRYDDEEEAPPPMSSVSARAAARKEVHALALLSCSPHVIRYFSSWEEDGRLFVQTEIAWGSLQDAIIGRRPANSGLTTALQDIRTKETKSGTISQNNSGNIGHMSNIFVDGFHRILIQMPRNIVDAYTMYNAVRKRWDLKPLSKLALATTSPLEHSAGKRHSSNNNQSFVHTSFVEEGNKAMDPAFDYATEATAAARAAASNSGGTGPEKPPPRSIKGKVRPIDIEERNSIERDLPPKMMSLNSVSRDSFPSSVPESALRNIPFDKDASPTHVAPASDTKAASMSALMENNDNDMFAPSSLFESASKIVPKDGPINFSSVKDVVGAKKNIVAITAFSDSTQSNPNAGNKRKRETSTNKSSEITSTLKNQSSIKSHFTTLSVSRRTNASPRSLTSIGESYDEVQESYEPSPHRPRIDSYHSASAPSLQPLDSYPERVESASIPLSSLSDGESAGVLGNIPMTQQNQFDWADAALSQMSVAPNARRSTGVALNAAMAVDDPSGSLSQRDRYKFTERDATIVLRDIASGLRDMHRAGLAHLDVKPANILICYEGGPALCDADGEWLPEVAALTGIASLDIMFVELISSFVKAQKKGDQHRLDSHMKAQRSISTSSGSSNSLNGASDIVLCAPAHEIISSLAVAVPKSTKDENIQSSSFKINSKHIDTSNNNNVSEVQVSRSSKSLSGIPTISLTRLRRIGRAIYKLGDLGQSAPLQSTDVNNDQIEEGDARYLSREMLQGDHSNLAAVDIFALGLTLFELCSGLPTPAEGDLYALLRNGVLPENTLEHISPQMRRLLNAMVHPDPSKRPTAEWLVNCMLVRCLPQTIFDDNGRADFSEVWANFMDEELACVLDGLVSNDSDSDDDNDEKQIIDEKL